MRRWALALALVSGAASAQDMPTVEDYARVGEFDRFGRCRAAAFYHLDGAPDPASAVPRPVARTLLDQIDFIAGLFVSGEEPGGVEDVQRILSIAERFFLGFNRELIETRDEFQDAARRDAVLLGCIPWIWATTRVNVDMVLAWRREMIGGPAPLSPEEANARLDRALKKLEAE